MYVVHDDENVVAVVVVDDAIYVVNDDGGEVDNDDDGDDNDDDNVVDDDNDVTDIDVVDGESYNMKILIYELAFDKNASHFIIIIYNPFPA